MPRRNFLSMVSVLALCALPVLAQEAEIGDAGAYLAANNAAKSADYSAAAEWYTRALLSDPANPALLEGALIANIGVGEIGPAATLAQVIVDSGSDSQSAHLMLLANAVVKDDFQTALTQSAKGAEAAALLDSLVNAWAKVGIGQMSDATAAFDKIGKTKGLEAFGLYHKALALASAGDFQGADDILSGKASGSIQLQRRGVIAYVEILSQLERNPDALALLNKSFTSEADPQLDDLRRRLAAGEPLAFDIVRNPTDGMAEVFFTVAAALSGEVNDSYALVYARLAQYLRPDHTEAALLTAGLLESQGQHDLATNAFAVVPPDSQMFYIAEMGRADATYAAGRKEAALEILQALARSHGTLAPVQVALADAYRRDERFADAKKVYDTALGMLGAPAPGHWALYFNRGICSERAGDFKAAETDMREALRLNPDQPSVLNYLGYSFVDRGENLDEALGMIQRAVAREPASGYIIDSLAWAYFRLGRYGDAVEPMERASLLEPVDPIVTDHLGDVYWAVGRTREAEFQWRRALSFAPLEKDAARMRKKLEIGLDAVLAAEGAPPLAQVEAKSDGN